MDLRRAFVSATMALVLGIAACAGAPPATADARERATCDAAEQVGHVVDALLSGKVRAGDPATLEELAVRARAVRQAAARTDNVELARASTKASVAADSLALPPTDRPRRFAETPEAMVLALRQLDEECRSLGVPVVPDG